MLGQLEQNHHLLAFYARQAEQLHDILIHNLIIMRPPMKLDIVLIEIEAVLAPGYLQRHVWEVRDDVAGSDAEAGLFKDLLVEDLGGRDLVVGVVVFGGGIVFGVAILNLLILIALSRRLLLLLLLLLLLHLLLMLIHNILVDIWNVETHFAENVAAGMEKKYYGVWKFSDSFSCK